MWRVCYLKQILCNLNGDIYYAFGRVFNTIIFNVIMCFLSIAGKHVLIVSSDEYNQQYVNLCISIIILFFLSKQYICVINFYNDFTTN